jgi:hypothetical protein
MISRCVLATAALLGNVMLTKATGPPHLDRTLESSIGCEDIGADASMPTLDSCSDLLILANGFKGNCSLQV